MICSILIPSRARPDRLINTIESIWHSTNNSNNIEIIIRLDDDDQISLEKVKEFQANQIVYGDRKNGYNSLGDFYAEMANVAQSPWIWIMNDDVIITGTGWDEQLINIPNQGVIVQPENFRLFNRDYTNYIGGAFPVVPNKCWQNYNHTIPNLEPIDHWLNGMLSGYGWKTQFLKGISLIHNRDDNETIEAHRKLS